MNRDWIDPEEYPFDSHYFTTDAGAMHYVDEGDGEVIVMVHGNPTWSFLYRHMIKGLSPDFRCIAPDHIGFGLSDKPQDFNYFPENHARNLEALLEQLDVREITLVVQDWGGPIGLSYAVQHPDKVKRLVIMNTWMWPVTGDRAAEFFSKRMGGTVGWFLIKRFNFFVRTVMPMAYGNKKKLTKNIHRHYFLPLQKKQDRKGCWVFPGQITASRNWLEGLWEQREMLSGKDVRIFWGLKDPAFRKKQLDKWIALFPNAPVVTYPDAGHYLQEEKGKAMAPVIKEFMQGSG